MGRLFLFDVGPLLAAGAVIAQLEGGTLRFSGLAHVGIAAANLDGVQRAVMIPVVGTAVDGTLNALVDGIHLIFLPFRAWRHSS